MELDPREGQVDFTFEIPSLPPDLIDGYELTDRIAEGGMGAVFHGRQVSLDRAVAVKVLKPRLAKDESFIKRFNREARAVARLNHKNVVTAIDVGESRGWHYLVMEYVDGPTLQALLEKKGALPEKDALRIAWQICSALRHADRHGMVHRDIKPDNVILSRSGDAKLCDLGLAKKMDSDVSAGAAEIVEKMLAKKPEDRYESPQEVMRALRLLATGRWKAETEAPAKAEPEPAPVEPPSPPPLKPPSAPKRTLTARERRYRRKPPPRRRRK